MKAIRVSEYGGPSVLKLEEVPTPQPRPNQVLVRILAVGVNPVDTYLRSNTTPPPFRFRSCSLPPTRSPHSHPPHWVRTSSRRPGTGKPLPTPNRRPSSAPAT